MVSYRDYNIGDELQTEDIAVKGKVWYEKLLEKGLINLGRSSTIKYDGYPHEGYNFELINPAQVKLFDSQENLNLIKKHYIDEKDLPELLENKDNLLLKEYTGMDGEVWLEYRRENGSMTGYWLPFFMIDYYHNVGPKYPYDHIIELYSSRNIIRDSVSTPKYDDTYSIYSFEEYQSKNDTDFVEW